MTEESIMANSHIRNAKVSSHVYEFYISGEIEGPEHYIDMYDIIRHSKYDDVVKFYINSYGGDLFSAIQFLRVMSDSEATVVVSIEGAAMSAATLLFLAADEVEITPNSSIMIHSYSSGTYGKGNEMLSQVTHERKWSEKLFKEIYADFLSDAEIVSVLEGKDIWLTSEETLKRLEDRAYTRRALEELEKATRPE